MLTLTGWLHASMLLSYIFYMQLIRNDIRTHSTKSAGLTFYIGSFMFYMMQV